GMAALCLGICSADKYFAPMAPALRSGKHTSVGVDIRDHNASGPFKLDSSELWANTNGPADEIGPYRQRRLSPGQTKLAIPVESYPDRAHQAWRVSDKPAVARRCPGFPCGGSLNSHLPGTGSGT